MNESKALKIKHMCISKKKYTIYLVDENETHFFQIGKGGTLEDALDNAYLAVMEIKVKLFKYVD